MQRRHALTIALERPGASGDQGVYSDRVELEGVRPISRCPTSRPSSAKGRQWGHVQVAGILRRMEWDDMNDDAYDLSGDAMGWGFNFSSNIKVAEGHVARLRWSTARASRTT